MINRTLLVPAILLVVACSKLPEQPPKSVELAGNDQMRYDINAFEAKPGQNITLTMKNIGTQPKDAMAHNFVLLAKNTDPAKFIEAGQSETANDYIPRAQASRVIAKTKLTGPGETDTITFRAPSVPGPYDYVCTFPGHYVSGMKGVMTVVP